MSDDEGSDNGEPQYGVVFEGEDPSKKPDKYLRRDGKAAAKFPNGDSYVGEYRNGKRHGAGIYTFANGTRFEGEYVDGVKEGQGKMLYPDGSVYSGGWVGDKRSGQGSYLYAAGAAKGDSYVGAWLNDKKHGKGTYTYASGSSITGEWSNGQVMHAKWNMADGSGFNGAWHKNQPSGFGLHAFVNGNQATGVYSIDRKEGYKWNSVAPVLSRSGAAAVAAVDAGGAAGAVVVDPMKVAQRFIDKCVLKADHFEGIWRIKKEVDGCPNLRKVADLPLFALGQPTRSGLKGLVEWAGETHATEKLVWVNLRSEPVVYVNDNSFIPRSKHALNSPMSLRGLAATAAASAAAASPAAAAATPEPQLTPVQLAEIESRLVSKLSLDVSHHGNLHRFLKDTYAEVASDRRSIELSEEVLAQVDEDTGKESFGQAIATPAKVFEDLLEESGADVEYHRIPLGGNGAFPSAEQVDAIVALVKAAEPSTGIVFNDQMGRGRATLASILATLMKRATEALAASAERADAEPEEEPEEEEPEPEQEDPEDPDADPDAERAPRPARAPRAARAAPLGRTDLADLDIPLFDPAQPNLKLGQYKLIMRLVREGLVVGGPAAGDQLKAEVDDAIDRCKAMQNLREIIQFSKDMYEKEEALAADPSAPPAASDASGARRAFWIASAHNYVERYAFLMLFHAYVKANVESDYENQTFAQFCKAKKDVMREYIGSRQEGPLKEFNWQ